MDFARKQMSKHGWSEGQGLGKDEEGIKEAVKVKIKQDKKGVGHDPGEEFSFHWWDHVFNKAASKISVSTTENGVEIKNEGDTKVSKNKNSKTYDNKAMLYGQFVKGSTLSDGLETREETVASSSDEEPGEKTQCLMPDQEEVVFKMCGGRTAHKGARHGLKLNGKLLRIQEQEKLLLDSYSSKSANQKERNNSEENLNGHGIEKSENEESDKLAKKSKKKKRKHRDDEATEEMTKEINDEEVEFENKTAAADDVSESVNKPKKRKKNKKSKRDCEGNGADEHNEENDRSCSNSVSDKGVEKTEAAKEIDNELTENIEVCKKMKKKKKKKQKN